MSVATVYFLRIIIFETIFLKKSVKVFNEMATKQDIKFFGYNDVLLFICCRCSYDYLMILENSSSDISLSNSTKRLCGDWSSKLKLLRYMSQGSRIKLRFSSDYSHHYGGFKARLSMENGENC